MLWCLFKLWVPAQNHYLIKRTASCVLKILRTGFLLPQLAAYGLILHHNLPIPFYRNKKNGHSTAEVRFFWFSMGGGGRTPQPGSK